MCVVLFSMDGRHRQGWESSSIYQLNSCSNCHGSNIAIVKFYKSGYAPVCFSPMSAIYDVSRGFSMVKPNNVVGGKVNVTVSNSSQMLFLRRVCAGDPTFPPFQNDYLIDAFFSFFSFLSSSQPPKPLPTMSVPTANLASFKIPAVTNEPMVSIGFHST